jgi:biopolymer transport protein ExbD
MLDMLTVVLIFLIVNFSPEKAGIKHSAEIQLPKSDMNINDVPRIHLELTRQEIKLNGAMVEGLSPNMPDASLAWDALRLKLDEFTAALRSAPEAASAKAEPILLIADKETPYEFVDRTVAHLAAGGYSEVYLLTYREEHVQ